LWIKFELNHLSPLSNQRPTDWFDATPTLLWGEIFEVGNIFHSHPTRRTTFTPAAVIWRTADSTADNPSKAGEGIKLRLRAPHKFKSTTT
jgi:hypothetical protein